MTKALPSPSAIKKLSPSTVGRNCPVKTVIHSSDDMASWSNKFISVQQGDSLTLYNNWKTPNVIISDGGYGVLGFEGDTSDYLCLPNWYEPHIAAWTKKATPSTTLWFWNSEIGWATVHPVLEKYGWRYINANIWNKGKGHIAGNINTAKIRRFPVVTEVCVQYVFNAKIDGLDLKEWLLYEWKRSGLAINKANIACGVANAASRKYLDQGHLWYFPPPEIFLKMQRYANKYGKPEGRPYFSLDGQHPCSKEQWATMRAKFYCPHGVTNVWDRPSLRGAERIKVDGSTGKAIHLNQKPLDLMTMIIEASSDIGDIVWEPFGGLFTACLAASKIKRQSFGAEINPIYYQYGIQRLSQEFHQYSLL